MINRNHRLNELARWRTWLAVGALALFAFRPISASAQAHPQISTIDQFVTTARVQWNVPGVAVAIVQGDRLVFAKGYGVRRVFAGENRQNYVEEAVDSNTLFAIASNTKAFTSAALAILVDEDKLNWGDPVKTHLPYFKLYDRFVTEQMTVRDLLCHRSGLGTYSGDLLWYGTKYTPQEILERARFLPKAGDFRSSYGYSNLMFLAAGEVVKSVSGQSWDEFVNARILNPLQMSRTVTSVTKLDNIENVATPHKTVGGRENLPIDWLVWDNMAAAGGIISSVHDMSQWLRLQLRRGKLNDRIFSDAASREMWQAHTSITISKTYREQNPTTHFRAYGLGWAMRDFKGRKVLSHGGGYDGMFSRVVLVPEEDLGMVILTNSMTPLPTVIANQILDEYLGGDRSPRSDQLLAKFKEDREKFDARVAESTRQRLADTHPSLPLEDYVGNYLDRMYGLATIKKNGEQLSLQFEANPDMVADLIHSHLDTFVVKWRREFAWFDQGNIQFEFDDRARVARFSLNIPNEDFWFHEFEFARQH